MPTVHLGAKNEPATQFQQSEDLLAVRTRSRRSLTEAPGPVATPAPAEISDTTLVATYPEAGVEVFRVPVARGGRGLADRKAALRAQPDVRFAGGVLVDPNSGEPVLYTENLFVKFVDQADPDAAREVLRAANLKIKRELRYAANAFFVEAPEGTGQTVFDIANTLLKRPDVEYSHPELVRPRARRDIFPQQWHLMKTTIGGKVVDAHANVQAAHQLTRGAGVTVAIIDDGVDVDHPEFAGDGRIVAPRDVTERLDDSRPKFANDKHGTPCAGVAVAAGNTGACGVAPAARLMPIRLASALGSQSEADAFEWAADHGADVISCSWGPTDGEWWNPADPAHQQVVPIPASTRLAVDYALREGRQGKGCVILFAAGNGNEPVENDGYASYPGVVAVAACNDTGRRSIYSDFGAAIWCSFPSGDSGFAPANHPDPLTPGIWTVDRRGKLGYNTGRASEGDVAGLFTNSFSGTSSACPGAAGVAALVLSVNPALKWHEVKDILRRACDRIDPQGGQYSAGGHSVFYGAGRLNARTAVELAKGAEQNQLAVTKNLNLPIPDLQTVTSSAEISGPGVIRSVSVAVDIRHTYIGDLEVALLPPTGLGTRTIVLHDRSGASRNDIRKSFDRVAVPALTKLEGKRMAGTWTLRVRDLVADDAGTLVSWTLAIDVAGASGGAAAATPAKSVSKPKAVRPHRRPERRAA